MPTHADNKQEIVKQLRQQLLRMQGNGSENNSGCQMGLGAIERTFPNGTFPTASIHEFIASNIEEAAASSGFISSLLSRMMDNGGTCLWISLSQRLSTFPPALAAFGIAPDRIIFVEVKQERDMLWAMGEALKCKALVAAVAELPTMDFVESQRLQLAAEKSRVTGFVLRSKPTGLGNTACAARWRISPLPSVLETGVPGVGLPRWTVELLKVRNGNPGRWEVEWSEGLFVFPETKKTIVWPKTRKQIG